LIPSKDVIVEYTKEGAKFDYLPLISDIKSFIKHDNYSLVEFKQEMQSKAIINLYLSSLSDLGAKPQSLKLSGQSQDMIEEDQQ